MMARSVADRMRCVVLRRKLTCARHPLSTAPPAFHGTCTPLFLRMHGLPLHAACQAWLLIHAPWSVQGWNRLDADSIVGLAEALRFNQSVISIELQHNALGADGGAALGEVLYDNRYAAVRCCGCCAGRRVVDPLAAGELGSGLSTAARGVA